MNKYEFAEKIINMPAEKQNEFFENLKKELSKEDWETTIKFISLFSMFNDINKYNSIKNAIRDQLCEEFYGHTVEPKKQIQDPCNPVYMTSIL